MNNILNRSCLKKPPYFRQPRKWKDICQSERNVNSFFSSCNLNCAFATWNMSHAESSLIRLTLSWRRLLSYRNQSIDLLRKSIDWFLYDNGLGHYRVNQRGFGKNVTRLPTKIQQHFGWTKKNDLSELKTKFCKLESDL